MHVQRETGLTLREAGSIRAKLTKLQSAYGTIDEAEEAYEINLHSYAHGNNHVDSVPTNNVIETNNHIVDSQSFASLCSLVTEAAKQATANEVKSLMMQLSTLLSEVELKAHIGDLFVSVTNRPHLKPYIDLSCAAVQKIEACGKGCDLLQRFARCIAECRPGSSESLMPLDRMPFGLIEYQVKFFTSSHVNQVHEPASFKSWRETMFSSLHGWQDRLLRGPMWSGSSKQEIGNPLKARVNIACISRRTVAQRLTKVEGVSTESVVQMEAIEHFALAHPNARVWVKADAKDIKPSLQESVRGVWNGDVDIVPGALQAQKDEYHRRKELCITTALAQSETDFLQNLVVVRSDLEADNIFLHDGNTTAIQKFEKAHAASQQNLIELRWDIAEFQQLSITCQELLNCVIRAMEADRDWQWKKRQLGDTLQHQHLTFLRNLMKKKRTAASHVLVVMISEEQRNTKPYATPVLYVPCRTLKDQHIRDLMSGVKERLREKGISVVGTVTDGEYCSLRSLGQQSITHLWDLIRQSRQSVQHKSQVTLEKMLFPVAVRDGVPEYAPNSQDASVPPDLSIFFHVLCQDGYTKQECIRGYRQNMFPAAAGEDYVPNTFRRNVPESYLDMLRSVAATLIFKDTLNQLREEYDRDFSRYLYIPEVIDGQVHHDRADHCHLLKRIAGHVRELRYQQLSGDAFRDAMLAPQTGLTHAALTGVRKQSVQDAERLLSLHVARWLQENGHPIEGQYVKIVAEWNEASDGRGLTQLQRCRANYNMLNYLLDDLMPWHTEIYDFSSIDINRPMDNIRGMSRETFVELTANIESQEYRRRQNSIIDYPEHPRASTTDDVEQCFAMCTRFLGNSFTLMEFKYHWRKICREFSRRLADDLPFYYWTVNERFLQIQPRFDEMPGARRNGVASDDEEEEAADDGDLDNDDGDDDSDDNDDGDDAAPNNTQAMQLIDAARNHPQRLHRLRLNRREDSSIFSANRQYLPTRYHRSLRDKFHRVATLPPCTN